MTKAYARCANGPRAVVLFYKFIIMFISLGSSPGCMILETVRHFVRDATPKSMGKFRHLQGGISCLRKILATLQVSASIAALRFATFTTSTTHVGRRLPLALTAVIG